jgi:transcriptional regulator with XRE-family HTH domain
MVHPLKQYRDDNGLTQPALAEQLGVTKATISRWESGTRSPRKATLPLIVEKTGISPGALLGIDQGESADAEVPQC